MRTSKYDRRVDYFIVPNGIVMVFMAYHISSITSLCQFISCTPEERDAFFLEHCVVEEVR